MVLLKWLNKDRVLQQPFKEGTSSYTDSYQEGSYVSIGHGTFSHSYIDFSTTYDLVD